MTPKRILVLGAGGREHALAWRLSRDPEPAEILVAPGNQGIARQFRCLPLEPTHVPSVVDACTREGVDLVVVGPEQPLAAGVADALAAAGIAVYGPTHTAARLESSKVFAKQVMAEAHVPTAAADACVRPEVAIAAIARRRPPYVVKADGLASGKGVCVTESLAEAEAFALSCLSGGRFGLAGARVLIEDHIEGDEVTMTAICDGTSHVLLPAARDYKRAQDGDAGPNTGGMGAFAPVPNVDDAVREEVSRRVIGPVLEAMARRGTPFRGTLYAGLMVVASGVRVLEFNVRFGDPETQVLMPILDGAFGRLLASAAVGRLEHDAVRASGASAVAVALVDEPYPEKGVGGGTIAGLARLEAGGEALVFHAGTTRAGEEWRVRWGRAAYVVGRGAGREEARATAYRAIDGLGGSGWRCRRDVAAAHVGAGT